MTGNGMKVPGSSVPSTIQSTIMVQERMVSAQDALKGNGRLQNPEANLNLLEYMLKTHPLDPAGMMMNFTLARTNMIENLAVLGVHNEGTEGILIVLSVGTEVIGLNELTGPNAETDPNAGTDLNVETDPNAEIDPNAETDPNAKTDLYEKKGEVLIGQNVANGFRIRITSKTEIESLQRIIHLSIRYSKVVD